MSTLVATAVYQQPWSIALIYAVITLVLARVANSLLKRREAAMRKLLGRGPSPAKHTRDVMVRRLVVAAILFLGIAAALFQFEEVKAVAQAMLASAAIVAAVVGIAARAPIANLVSGIMVAFSQAVRLNDHVKIAGCEGTVERITLTYTFLRADDGRRVVIPNETFVSSAVENCSLGSPECTVTVDVTVPLATDLDACRAALQETMDGLATPPEGERNRVEIAGIGGGEVRLHGWAADPQSRQGLADDLRVAALRRLIDDGVLPSAHEDRDAG
jgi:small-conductance mechanosensitive channel